MTLAKQENQDAQHLEKRYQKEDENIAAMNDALEQVSGSFKELSVFKGRFLRYIYEDRREAEQEYQQERAEVVSEYRHAAPMSPYQQRQSTIKRG
jgi:hypothetical protein